MTTVGANCRLRNAVVLSGRETHRMRTILDGIAYCHAKYGKTTATNRKNMIISHCTTDALVHRFVAFAIRRRRV